MSANTSFDDKPENRSLLELSGHYMTIDIEEELQREMLLNGGPDLPMTTEKIAEVKVEVKEEEQYDSVNESFTEEPKPLETETALPSNQNETSPSSTSSYDSKDSSSSPTSSNSPDYQRFTSNASTSSIHNDLKMILEESKSPAEKATVAPIVKPTIVPMAKVQVPQAKSPKSKAVAFNVEAKKLVAKQQRVQVPKKDRSLNDSATKTEKNEKMNLIDMVMSMMKNSNDKNSMNKRYRYSKEFLMQIRQQRAAFVDQIYPDIFKAYSYCMTGNCWDPEKYFDIIQFQGKYDDVNTIQQSKKQYPTSNVKAHQSYSSKVNTRNVDSPKSLPVPCNSPKDFIKPTTQTHKKTSPMANTSATMPRHSNSTSILSSLGLDLSLGPMVNASFSQADSTQGTMSLSSSIGANADQMLLDLIRKKESPKSNNNGQQKAKAFKNSTSFIEMLSQQKSKPSASILDNLFDKAVGLEKTVGRSKSTQQIRPKVLTAQELEAQQMNELKHQQQQRTGSRWTKADIEHMMSTVELNQSANALNRSNLSELSQASDAMMHDVLKSDAYKQLMNNLNNHPLNATKSKPVPASISSDMSELIKKLHSQSPVVQQKKQIDEDGSLLLKKMLNLKCTETSKVIEPKHKHHHKSSNVKQVSNCADLEKSAHSRSVLQQLKSQQMSAEDQHFNSLLNKITSPKVQLPKTDDSILKWFNNENFNMSGKKTVMSLSEIEQMERQRAMY